MSENLTKTGFQTVHAMDDADCLIVRETLERAKKGTIVLAGEDTDLLVLLLYHTTQDHNDIFFAPGQTAGKKQPRIWEIKKVQQVLGPDVCDRILFAHAITGCDTTNRMFSIGKSQSVKKLTLEHFKQQADIFSCSESTHEQIAEAGERAVVSLYGGEVSDTLDELRFVKYIQKISTASKLTQPNVLPPTSSAGKYHSYRTYFQVQIWKHLGDSRLQQDPQNWGWEKQRGMLLPAYTDKPSAPDELLTVIRCNCKAGCGTAACSCRKHGLVCSTGCSHCRGESCLNAVNTIHFGESDSEPEC